MSNPNSVWVDTAQPSVRIFATADATDELTCTQCSRPIGNAPFATELVNGTVTAIHDRCLPEDERLQAQEQRRLGSTFSRLWGRLSGRASAV